MHAHAHYLSCGQSACLTGAVTSNMHRSVVGANSALLQLALVSIRDAAAASTSCASRIWLLTDGLALCLHRLLRPSLTSSRPVSLLQKLMSCPRELYLGAAGGPPPRTRADALLPRPGPRRHRSKKELVLAPAFAVAPRWPPQRIPASRLDGHAASLGACAAPRPKDLPESLLSARRWAYALLPSTAWIALRLDGSCHLRPPRMRTAGLPYAQRGCPRCNFRLFLLRAARENELPSACQTRCSCGDHLPCRLQAVRG